MPPKDISIAQKEKKRDPEYSFNDRFTQIYRLICSQRSPITLNCDQADNNSNIQCINFHEIYITITEPNIFYYIILNVAFSFANNKL